MLVYSLKKPLKSLQPAKKVEVGAEVGNSSSKNVPDLKLSESTKMKTINEKEKLDQKEQIWSRQVNSRQKLQLSNSAENSAFDKKPEKNKEQIVLSNDNIKREVPLLESTLKLERTTSHPLFGSVDQKRQSEEVPKAPSWYLQGHSSHLIKRKPEETLSKESNSKKLTKLHNSGLNRLKDMRRKVRILKAFTSLPISRVASMEVS